MERPQAILEEAPLLADRHHAAAARLAMSERSHASSLVGHRSSAKSFAGEGRICRRGLRGNDF